MSFINVFFNKGNEQKIMMQTTSDTLFAELALKYFQKTGIDQKQDLPKFIYNSKSIPHDSCKSMEELGIRDGAKIDVVIGAAVIGAINK